MLNLANEMATGSFRPKIRELLDRYEKTLYRAAKDGEISYSTVHRWLNEPDAIERIEGKILFGFLLGLGLSLDEVNELRLGDVFEFTPEKEQEPAK